MPKNILPNDTWLKANGYSELVKARKDRPELFSTPQDSQPVSERATFMRPPSELTFWHAFEELLRSAEFLLELGKERRCNLIVRCHGNAPLT